MFLLVGALAHQDLQQAPDLAIEVLSPSESRTDVASKLADYRFAGTPLVWLIDPAARTVRVISATEDDVSLGEDQVLSGGNTLPGFTCAVRGLFEGVLEVTHPEQLRDTLAHGIGPGKAFGFGLLSVARGSP